MIDHLAIPYTVKSYLNFAQKYWIESLFASTALEEVSDKYTAEESHLAVDSRLLQMFASVLFFREMSDDEMLGDGLDWFFQELETAFTTLPTLLELQGKSADELLSFAHDDCPICEGIYPIKR